MMTRTRAWAISALVTAVLIALVIGAGASSGYFGFGGSSPADAGTPRDRGNGIDLAVRGDDDDEDGEDEEREEHEDRDERDDDDD